MVSADLAARCCDWARAIADALTAEAGPPENGLTAGDAGIAVFLGYAARWSGEPAHATACERRLDRAVEAASAGLDPFLYSGATGAGWALEHLCGRVVPANDGDVNADTDELVATVLAGEELWAGRWELMHGLVGLGVYLLERPPSARRAELLAAVVDRLAASERVDGDAGVWWSRLDPAFADGVENLGLSHGAAGVVAFLARALRERAVDRAPAAGVLRRGVAAISRSQLPGAGGFPAYGGEPARCRLGWCYGELSAAPALAAAGAALDEPAWRAAALAAGQRAAARGAAASGVVDPGLCHGAVGVAHVLGRLADELASAELAAASARWIEHALALRGDGGIAGVRAFALGQWREDPGFLLGAAGVGLGLLTAAGVIGRDWDRPLLLG